MSNKFLRTVTVLCAVSVFSFCSGCGERKSPAMQDVDVHEKCKVWCKAHKVAMGFDSVRKRVSFIIEGPMDAGLVPFEIEQGGKSIQLPGQSTTLNASLQAIAKFASFMKEEIEESKNGNATVFTTKASLLIGDLAFETMTIEKSTTVEKEDGNSVLHNISQTISLKEKDKILLRQNFNGEVYKIEYSDSIKTYQDFDVLTKKNGLRMTIPYASFNKETAAFVFVFLPIQSIDTTTNGEK